MRAVVIFAAFAAWLAIVAYSADKLGQGIERSFANAAERIEGGNK